MQSWPAPALPVLPGVGRPVRVHDTASGQVVTTTPGRTARLYVCGITPYDATHMGHAATYVAFDLLVRTWRDSGHDVHYVQNVTDVDDPLLARADSSGEDWRGLAEREIALFRDDMTALRVIPPQDYVGAVESIPLVVEYVQKLAATDAVYAVDGDLYFRVHADERFGQVAGLSGPAMLATFAERGGDPARPGKRDPLDCLLWQAERPGEPAWDSPLGRGRPGWHIECAAIALDTLGMTIDVQGGGSDLAFPHHEMGASEAQVATGQWPYAKAYVHAGMVGYQGEKMSKSKGNLVFVSKLRAAGHDPMALRLALLAHHYREDWEWTDDGLRAAEARLAHWRAAVACTAAPSATATLDAIRERLADDLDAPGALAAVDRWAEDAGGLDDHPHAPDAPALVTAAVDALLGVTL
jgi:L-cysteine:1D-myo-inositol 2-amino-2-deoxy-alpha-D-glucopyranoside ligase